MRLRTLLITALLLIAPVRFTQGATATATGSLTPTGSATPTATSTHTLTPTPSLSAPSATTIPPSASGTGVNSVTPSVTSPAHITAMTTLAPTQEATVEPTVEGTSTKVPLKLAVSGTMGLNNWYTSSVTVKAVNPSGPLELSLDGGPFLLVSFIQITADGKHQVIAHYVGQRDDSVMVEVDVDQTPPVFDETHTDTQEGVHVDSVSGHDDVSGLAQAYVDGNRIVLIDKAGNRAERVVAP